MTWLWWMRGLGWLFMPRMTIGLLLVYFFPNYFVIGIILAVIGAVFDIGSRADD